ncbi:MAG: phosphatase PAP2 family protein [Alicyclobacillus sp.]|nr:phosphatase PAP2 family protein [Alicyclobacillus sp.]
MFAPDFAMPSGMVWQYEVIRWFQSWASVGLTELAKALSLLGVEWFYVVVLPILFWAVSKPLGLRLAYVFLCSMYANGWLKDSLKVLRPIGIPGIESWMTWSATGYSMPAGHAQGPMTFWVMVCRWAGRRWLWIAAMILVAAIGLSRVYLGVHWPLDVLAGWALGLVFGVLGWPLGRWWTKRQYAWNVRMWLSVLFPLALMVIHSGPDSLRYAALLMGIGAGATLEERWVGGQMDPAWWRRACAVIIGIAGLIALQYVIKWPGWPGVTVVRDVLTGLWATLAAPWVFVQCGLYRKGDPVEG